MHFIGYSNESKGYRLLNPITNQLYVSRDVVFDQMASWKWDDTNNQAPTTYEILEQTRNSSNSSSSTNLHQNFEDNALATIMYIRLILFSHS